MNMLRVEGLDARQQDIYFFEPDKDFDLLIVSGFSLSPENLRRLLAQGHIICEPYQAGRLHTNPDFNFVEDLETLGTHFDDQKKGYFLFRRV